MTGRGERVALASFVGTSILAGGNGVAIRFSNRELAPLWGASLRFLLASAVLLAVMALRGMPWPRGPALAGAVAYGALDFALAFGLAYYALVRMQAGFGSVLLALVPLVTLLLAVAERQERLRLRSLLGTLVALSGVLVAARAPLSTSVPAASFVAGLGSAFCLAQAAVLVRRLPRVHPITMNAVGMLVGGLLLLIATFVVGEPKRLPSRRETWGALAYIVLVGSVVVFVLFLLVLRYWPASRAAYAFAIITTVTILLSAWLDAEPLRADLLLGGTLVLVGVYVGALSGGPQGPPGSGAVRGRLSDRIHQLGRSQAVQRSSATNPKRS